MDFLACMGYIYEKDTVWENSILRLKKIILILVEKCASVCYNKSYATIMKR